MHQPQIYDGSQQVMLPSSTYKKKSDAPIF